MKRLIYLLCILVVLSIFIPVSAIASISVDLKGDVEGIVGQRIVNQFVTLTLEPSSECYFNVSEDDDITDWFTNIPDNLTAIVDRVYDNNIDVRFSEDLDDSNIESKYLISVSIPSDCIYYGSNLYEDVIDYIDDDSYFIIHAKEEVTKEDPIVVVPQYIQPETGVN